MGRYLPLQNGLWSSLQSAIYESRIKSYLRAHHGLASVPGVPGDFGVPGVSLPDVLRIEAAELGYGASLQRGLYLVCIIVDQRFPFEREAHPDFFRCG